MKTLKLWKTLEVLVVILMLTWVICVSLVFVCQKVRKPPQWGNGDPPAQWQEQFGNDNGARLDFIQSRLIENQGKALTKVVAEIESLKKLNAEQHKKLGETDVKFHERIKAMELTR